MKYGAIYDFVTTNASVDDGPISILYWNTRLGISNGSALLFLISRTR